MKLRKLLAACMALLMCLAASPVLPAAAEEEVIQIPVVNAGFEEDMTGWSPMDENTGVIDETKAHSGSKSLKIVNSKGNNPWVCQYVTLPKQGAMYELSAFLNVDVATPDTIGTGFKVESYAGSEYLNNGSFDVRLFMNTNNMWVKHSMVFQPPVNATRIKIYMRNYSLGTTWFDDVEVKLTGGPKPYDFFSTYVFHYPDQETGDAYVYLDKFYEAGGEEETSVYADFSLMDGDAVLHETKNVSIIGHEAKYIYPVSVMTEKEKQYKLRAKLYKKATGEFLEEWEQNVYVYDRPEWMPEDGKFVINGEPFNPIIGYHVDPDMCDDIIKGGINTAQVGYGIVVQENRDLWAPALRESGVKGIACLYVGGNAAGHPDNIEKTKATINALKDNDSIIAWAVQDEPLGGENPPNKQRMQWLEDSYRLIRSLDKKRPVYLLDYGANHKYAVRYGDVFVADVYQRGASAAAVSQIIEPLTKNHPRISTYELACAYEAGDVFPPVRTIRASVYRGLEAGGSYGTGYYAVSDAIGHDKEDEDKPLYELPEWEPITTINTVEMPIMFEYVNGYSITSFNRYREGEQNREHLWETWFNEEGEMYLLAHNRSEQTAEFNIPLVSKNGKIRVGEYKAEPIGLTETGEKSGNGSMQLTLEQEQIALYKITPAEKVDLSLIDAPTFDDLDGDYAWAKDAVMKTQALGIINGKGEGIFAPGEAITRGDFAGFLIRTLGFTSESTENFADVPAEREYAKEIAAGKALGILNGVGENIFSPDLAITRQDMMTICARGMKLAQKLMAAEASVLDAFHDKMNVADYALESVSAMIQSGIIKGDDAGYLNPTGNTRRAEAAVIMERILNAETVAHVPSETPDAPKVENEVVEFDAPTEAQMTKYNRSAALLKGLGTDEIKVAESILNGDAEAAVTKATGFTFDAFGENHKALRTDKAVEEFVKLLGYEVYTGRDGGFMGVASRIDLLRGVDISEEYLRGGEFALMLENALGIYLCDRVAFGEGAKEEYAESADTLLTRYRHLTLHKGVLEQNENTGLAKGYVAVGTALLETGETDAKNFIGQRVEAYTEGEDSTIVFIRANKSVTVTRIAADKIEPSETNLSQIAYEEEGHTKSIDIRGAQMIFNGKYKTGFTAADLMPDMGAVTLIENGGAGAAYIIVEKYQNYIVESTFAEDDQIFFKNRDALTWNEKDSSLRLTMEGGDISSLKEWNVLSLYESEDKKVVRAVVSTDTVKGTVTETSKEQIILEGETYKLATGMVGTPEIGKAYTYILDAEGRIAAVDTKGTLSNYVYYTSIFKEQGISGKVQIRVFTPAGEMKVLDVEQTVRYNDTPIPSADLMGKTELIKEQEFIGQLMVIETRSDENGVETVSAINTAKNGMIMENEERWSTFTMDETIGHDKEGDPNYAGKRRYEGHDALYIGGKYLVEPSTVYFVVPEKYASDASKYKAYPSSVIKHSDNFEDTKLYDVNEDQEIAVIVRTLVDASSGSVDGQPGVVKRLGRALNADGEEVLSITLQRMQEETYYFPTDDFQISMDKTITSIAKGEPMTETKNGVKQLLKTLEPANLEVGDVVYFQTSVSDPKVVSSMRVLCRANYAVNAEYSQESISEYYNYSPLTYAFGKIDRIVKRGFMMKPKEFERLFITDIKEDKDQKPIVLVEGDEIRTVTADYLRVGDKVYAQKCNPWHQITVIYR